MDREQLLKEIVTEIRILKKRLLNLENKIHNQLGIAPEEAGAGTAEKTGKAGGAVLEFGGTADFTDVLDMSDPFRRIIVAVTREGEMSPAQIAAAVEEDEPVVKVMLKSLVKQDYIKKLRNEDGSVVYKPVLRDKKGAAVPKDIWDKLDAL